MASVLCIVDDCKHRSKSKVRDFKYPDGSSCYRCSLKYILVRRIYDMDGEAEALLGKEETAQCSNYEFER